MKTFLRTFSALLAGAFLNLGWMNLAERLDLIGSFSELKPHAEMEVAAFCISGGGDNQDSHVA